MTGCFGDAAARLSGTVPLLLGWTPEAFWNATPAELAAILAPGASDTATPLSRGELNALMEQDRDD